ncbi:hypothetical protein CC77DRAFT_1010395 [Alternaria alternata]|uniref:Uncharacterized protein n=1 Tax=Alternaria alternata TaxID=5599 RepID=A0A177DG30_ALTAL|nr:hypothetical protein CC77DRAFT_1010395 [Alternaria alternata]XP_051585164.1 uncharacterized protein J4E82_008837 [Alternaria postmessia]KAI5372461.1 hypothetical protein J4E82_008837 [Alternaria postmessia]OAG18436.1 hypothetical protein CC77DRAFT_1010395 [Alternaria alternata]
MAVVEHQALTICGDGTRYAPHLGTKAPNKDAQHHFVYVPEFAQGRYTRNIFASPPTSAFSARQCADHPELEIPGGTMKVLFEKEVFLQIRRVHHSAANATGLNRRHGKMTHSTRGMLVLLLGSSAERTLANCCRTQLDAGFALGAHNKLEDNYKQFLDGL